MLPITLAEALIITETINEEITISHCIIDWQSSCVSDRIRVWWQLGALKQESFNSWVLLQSLIAKVNDAWRHIFDINFTANCYLFKSWNVLSSNKNESFILNINSTFSGNEAVHRFQSLTIRSDYSNLFIFPVSTGDSRQLC